MPAANHGTLLCGIVPLELVLLVTAAAAGSLGASSWGSLVQSLPVCLADCKCENRYPSPSNNWVA
jgi:hypothetical protein